MGESEKTRRGFLVLTATAGSAWFLSSGTRNRAAALQVTASERGAEPPGDEVTANEDLMREHGVLRRALLVYAEAAARLRRDPASVPPAALQDTARLFRSFGEEYHEKKLEEAFIFPAVRQAGGATASYPDLLVAQHRRGREITDYVLAATRDTKLGANAGVLAGALDGFVRMYQHHAAREDTIVFPAWRRAISDAQYEEMGEKFEAIEHEMFGADGFADAVRRIGDIETSLGLADLAQFTAPPPPGQ